MTDTPEDPLISPGEAARMLHVETKTLQRMVARGEITALVLPSGHRRYRLTEIEKIRGAS